jgi:tetraacyldisaccharide 4'-kinase
MKRPEFWHKFSIISIFLLPFAAIYLLIYYIRCFASCAYKSEIPVLCIGNIIAGGAGKTPVAISICQMAKKTGKRVVFLSKGYGGLIKEPTDITDSNYNARQCGDEALLLKKYSTTIISYNRRKGLEFINKNYAGKFDFIIMDDGFQNPTIYKDKSILVFDGLFGLGNNLILPSGPLRQSLSSAMKVSDLCLIIGEDKKNIGNRVSNKTNANIVADTQNIDKTKQYIAFTGIGNPEKFFSSLKENNINIKDQIVFADHYLYNDDDIKKLRHIAKENDAKLITTEKDLARLGGDNQNNIATLPISIKWQDEDEIKELIEQIC